MLLEKTRAAEATSIDGHRNPVVHQPSKSDKAPYDFNRPARSLLLSPSRTPPDRPRCFSVKFLIREAAEVGDLSQVESFLSDSLDGRKLSVRGSATPPHR